MTSTNLVAKIRREDRYGQSESFWCTDFHYEYGRLTGLVYNRLFTPNHFGYDLGDEIDIDPTEFLCVQQCVEHGGWTIDDSRMLEFIRIHSDI